MQMDQKTSTDFMALSNKSLEQRISVTEPPEVVDKIMTLNQYVFDTKSKSETYLKTAEV